jgi:hypothetical protein
MAMVLANPADVTACLSDNPVPNPANTMIVFQTCLVVNTIFDVCILNAHQKFALIWQGIMPCSTMTSSVSSSPQHHYH